MEETVTPIHIDDLVIILDSSLPRHQWHKGRVVKTYPSRYGQVRFADVKTRCGTSRRPVSKLAVLNFGEPVSVHEGGGGANVRV